MTFPEPLFAPLFDPVLFTALVQLPDGREARCDFEVALVVNPAVVSPEAALTGCMRAVLADRDEKGL